MKRSSSETAEVSKSTSKKEINLTSKETKKIYHKAFFPLTNKCFGHFGGPYYCSTCSAYSFTEYVPCALVYPMWSCNTHIRLSIPLCELELFLCGSATKEIKHGYIPTEVISIICKIITIQHVLCILYEEEKEDYELLNASYKNIIKILEKEYPNSGVFIPEFEEKLKLKKELIASIHQEIRNMIELPLTFEHLVYLRTIRGVLEKSRNCSFGRHTMLFSSDYEDKSSKYSHLYSWQVTIK